MKAYCSAVPVTKHNPPKLLQLSQWLPEKRARVCFTRNRKCERLSTPEEPFPVRIEIDVVTMSP